ncbi:N-acetylglucosamine-1-phosphodiester alpha-N-acetylglucosaminidase-like [Saccostrea cucullata]|uniref:N-acetylglucosamine-1-phosphodiester alpha-N-acetylglucosaminidase-like n=1 Tax=Saccostrea cuccullata TaxID=36930 RepID=UPI002ED68D8D
MKMIIILLLFGIKEFTTGRDGMCTWIDGSRGCCAGTIFNSALNRCENCSTGYFGFNCTDKCVYPSFGNNCQRSCLCDNTSCHFAKGCPQTTEKIDTFGNLKEISHSTCMTQKVSSTVTTWTSLIVEEEIYIGNSIIRNIIYSLVFIVIISLILLCVLTIYQKYSLKEGTCTRSNIQLENL